MSRRIIDIEVKKITPVIASLSYNIFFLFPIQSSWGKARGKSDENNKSREKDKYGNG